jgi:head-tail adaptor
MARPHAMHAGRLRDRVRIEVPVEERDSGGQPVKTWRAVDTVWACVEPATAREEWGGSRGVRPDVSEVVTVRHRQDIIDAGAEMRLVVVTQNDRVLQAVGVERGETPVWLTIPCKSAGKRV